MNLEASLTPLGEAGVEALVIEREGEVFPSYEDPSNVLFVRQCIRTIFNRLEEQRRSSSAISGSRYAAVIGQPGIGKSYALFYLAYRFLQQDDVDIVLLEHSEEGFFYVFRDSIFDMASLPEKCRDYRIRIGRDERLIDWLYANPRVVYLVDMAAEKPPTYRVRTVGFSVFSSSPRPYKKHLEGIKHKISLRLYSPPPWAKEELRAVYDYDGGSHLGISAWKRSGSRTFDRYFDTFGGTLRPMHKMAEELERMESGATKLEKADPAEILELVQEGSASPKFADDTTHSLFAEVGGSSDLNYVVPKVPTRRQFRSRFAEFLFKKFVAPRILFKAYTTDVLQILYAANSRANGSERGCKFEDMFHKLLPLGKWTIREVPTETSSPLDAVASWVGAFFNLVGGKQEDYYSTIDLKSIPVVQRSQDYVREEDISEWDGDSVNTEDNRRDVAHLIDTWKTNQSSFYWIPRGDDFPGIDSVVRNGSTIYFVQVKTGEIATKTHKWIEGAFKYARLLLARMDNTSGIEVTILLGTEPSKPPVLGKRKRDSLKKAKYPTDWKIMYCNLPEDVKSSGYRELPPLNISEYERLESEFANFCAVAYS